MVNFKTYREKVFTGPYKICTIFDKNYPINLSFIDDRPALFYYKGKIEKEDKNAIAFVGARKCTDYGKWSCKKIVEGFKDTNIRTVSGLAYGIDAISHKVSLENNIKTIGVIGSGLDIIYPKANKYLYEKIQEKGVIISEFPLETPPNSYNFPRRNRIISGLSKGVCVIEAKEKSGTMITTNFALDQGREVFCLPGNINSIYSKGCNKLIQEGSKLVMDAAGGKTREKIVEYKNLGDVEKHIARPILSGDGDILAIIYMTRNLNSIYSVIEDSKVIITYATLISLLTTSILGYFIANSITGPIRTLTKKAKALAKGNFNQSIEVKSKDEIGELGMMFNFLTKELRESIEKMDLERSKLDTIFNYMAEGVIAIDRKNRLIHANSIAKKILNISEKDFNRVINLKSINLYNIDYKNEESLRGEELTKIANSFYKIKYAPYKSDAFINSGLIIVLQDVDKEHMLDIMRKEFVANVSHEL
ncbi:MAG: DNA-processing protein DprA, partial [Anaerococcus sp.]|nr:DNA-processing protein DprA [Anaerococcus sp.]